MWWSLWVALWMFVGSAWGTSSGPIPSILVVDADCETSHAPDSELRIHFQTRVQTCAPGGPCEIIQDEPRNASGLWVDVKGCDAPLKGHFKKTGDKCDRRPIWAFSGTLPAGSEISVRGKGTSLGWLRVGGDPEEVKCEPTKPPKVHSKRTTTQDPIDNSPQLDENTLEVASTDDGWEVRFIVDAWAPGIFPPGTVLTVQTEDRPEDLLGRRAVLTFTPKTVRTDLTRYNDRMCDWVTTQECALTIDEFEPVLRATTEKSGSSPGPCPSG